MLPDIRTVGWLHSAPVVETRHDEEGLMRMLTLSTVLATAVLLAATLFAQQPATAAQMEANKKVAMEFFRVAGDARVALADPTYKQHNPAFVKGGREAGLSDYDYFKQRFGGAGAAGRQGGGPAGRGQQTGPQPPAGNPLEIVMAECDLVTDSRP